MIGRRAKATVRRSSIRPRPDPTRAAALRRRGYERVRAHFGQDRSRYELADIIVEAAN
jgi:hypothetical protein